MEGPQYDSTQRTRVLRRSRLPGFAQDAGSDPKGFVNYFCFWSADLGPEQGSARGFVKAVWSGPFFLSRLQSNTNQFAQKMSGIISEPWVILKNMPAIKG